MPIRNQNWYNLQSTRRYPLDDLSTGVDDSGAFIRDDIIVDCHVRFPDSFGQYAYVQGINVTENLVTVVIGAANDLTGTNSRTIAVVTVSKPVAANVNIELTPVRYGVSGWIVFGPGIDNNFVGRYTTPAQTFIGLRNARPYTNLPIPTLGKLGRAAALDGVINLLATSPLVATYYENYDVPIYDPATDTTTTTAVRAIVVAGEAPTATFNPYKEFLGPCSERPESGTCPKVPIERVAGVSPDCVTGNINIVVGGGLSSTMFQECGGVDITTDRGLSTACTPDETPREPRDKCPCPDRETSDPYCWPTTDGEPTICPREIPEEIPELPLCISFDPCINNLFNDRLGGFTLKKIVAPPICCPTTAEPFSNHYTKVATSVRSLNIALLRAAASDWAYGREVSAEILISDSNDGRKNAGIILNYVRVPEDNRCRTKYVAIMLDQNVNELQIKRFDGQSLIKESSIPVVTVLNRWYKISGYAVLTAGANDAATLVNAQLQDVETGAVIAGLTTTVQNYELVDGKPGIITDGSIAHFNQFRIA